MRAALFAALALSLSAVACSKPEATIRRDDRPITVDTTHHGAPLAGRDPDRGVPVYDLDVPLTDQDGAKVSLDVYRGHPVMIAMFYATCPNACPLLVSAIDKIDRSLDPATRKDTRILLVSFDPSRDGPEQLRAVVERHGLDTHRWKLASAPEGKARELAALLGVQYRKTADGGFAHSSVVTVLDPSGRIAARIDGLAQPKDELVEALRGSALPVR